MDKKLEPGHFRVNAMIYLFIMVLFPILFSFATDNTKESGRSARIDPFIKKFITHHATPIGESGQLIFATNRDSSSFHVTIHALEKNKGIWHLVFPTFAGLIGEKGFAAIDKKREGDGKTPSGLFPLGVAFGYGPSVVTQMPYRQATDDDFWAILPDERYVANPQKGSRHNRASAVDVTLVDSRGKELQMPTGFDDFSPRAHHRYQDLPNQAIRNRELLRGLMEKAGFIPFPEEWWHYDDDRWVQFDMMDLSFEDLLKHQNEAVDD
jgi:hypothetical protein